jgi:hypothetical protein
MASEQLTIQAEESPITSEPTPQDISPWQNFTICLPHPYLTRYDAISIPPPEEQHDPTFQLIAAPPSASSTSSPSPPVPLHNSALSFSVLIPGNDLPVSDNTTWARARRSPSTTISWTSVEPPTIGQLWLVIYAYFTVYHEQETIRLTLSGTQTALIRSELTAVGLAIAHPLPINLLPGTASETWARLPTREVVLLRSAFWQGAGSPFGPRSAWLPTTPANEVTPRAPLTSFPPLPTTQTLTTLFPTTRVHTLHPLRPAKPAPGSTVYSRYIPHLDEHFSMRALDPYDATHLNLFHSWQNDPRVAAGWNESGDLAHHLSYLLTLHADPHTLPLLAYFNDAPFAYFEVYWAREDHFGAHFPAYLNNAWDRGRHSLVGDSTFRGPHRAHAWWASLMHYMFLDEVRTEAVVGEPKETNTRVLELDALHGFHVEGVADLGHKRSALVRCSRERFFALCTVGKPWAGTGKGSKL